MTYSTSKIVVPIDFSGESRHAIARAVNIAGDASRLHLVHVLLPLDTVSPGVLLGDVSDDSRRKTVTEKLNTLAAEHGAAEAAVSVLLGTPGMEIADYAKDQDADLIVIPSHGYHGIKRMFLGSVAERVIRHAECSVLVLRRSDAE
ncbi:MAG: universal stress protein [Fuerstiella sp.]|nr:universal stress protein [Fuerstiella sp.]MCP4513253.1 universal stress protein [Fuerstiella sp.]